MQGIAVRAQNSREIVVFLVAEFATRALSTDELNNQGMPVEAMNQGMKALERHDYARDNPKHAHRCVRRRREESPKGFVPKTEKCAEQFRDACDLDLEGGRPRGRVNKRQKHAVAGKVPGGSPPHLQGRRVGAPGLEWLEPTLQARHKLEGGETH